jgi:hypothetical protein
MHRYRAICVGCKFVVRSRKTDGKGAWQTFHINKKGGGRTEKKGRGKEAT